MTVHQNEQWCGWVGAHGLAASRTRCPRCRCGQGRLMTFPEASERARLPRRLAPERSGRSIRPGRAAPDSASRLSSPPQRLLHPTNSLITPALPRPRDRNHVRPRESPVQPQGTSHPPPHAPRANSAWARSSLRSSSTGKPRRPAKMSRPRRRSLRRCARPPFHGANPLVEPPRERRRTDTPTPHRL